MCMTPKSKDHVEGGRVSDSSCKVVLKGCSAQSLTQLAGILTLQRICACAFVFVDSYVYMLAGGLDMCPNLYRV